MPDSPDAPKPPTDADDAKSSEQKRKESKAFLEDERKRELPKDSWPGKGQH